VLEPVAETWLELQCETVPGVRQAVIVIAETGQALRTLAQWPAGIASPADLVAAGEAAIDELAAVAHPRSEDYFGTSSIVAVPFEVGRGIAGAVILCVEHDPDGSVEIVCKSLVDLLQPRIRSLEILAREAGSADLVVAALETVAAALEQQSLRGAAMTVATELATRLQCERVAIGIARGDRIRIEALSHVAVFDVRSALVRDLEAAMEEATDQDATVVYPPGLGTPRVTLAHVPLVRDHGSGVAWSVPLGSAGEIVGAMTFERFDGSLVEEESVRFCEDLGALLGPILALRRDAGAGWFERTRVSVRATLSKLRESGHLDLKAAVLGSLLLVAFLLFAHGEYRVTADARLEGRVQRAIVAGLDGFISEANARAGDLVQKGQILGRLEDRDLLLEQRGWTGRHAQLLKEYRGAFAGHDRSQAGILTARIDQAIAQLELLDAQLARTRLVAPFDGTVVSGDLSQSLGSPVERGEVIFQIAPLDGYRIILEVDERDIADIVVGQRGQLALSAFPEQQLQLTLQRITPVSSPSEGHNRFRVEARLDAQPGGLRPGMEGVAKVEIERRRLIWIWTHDLVDWLHLQAWAWMP
jgi:RND family efflux transporter MFP subunit